MRTALLVLLVCVPYSCGKKGEDARHCTSWYDHLRANTAILVDTHRHQPRTTTVVGPGSAPPLSWRPSRPPSLQANRAESQWPPSTHISYYTQERTHSAVFFRRLYGCRTSGRCTFWLVAVARPRHGGETRRKLVLV